MSIGVPEYLRLEELLYSNALATAERARDARTDRRVIALSAPASTAMFLDFAHGVLLKLRDIHPPLAGLPNLIDRISDETGAVVLIFEDVQGGQLSDRLLRPTPVPEQVLLEVARQQAGLVGTLHEMGYGGLRPTPREVWLWSDGNVHHAAFLGWEWVAQSTDDASGDIRAAAGLWIELASGAPPEPDLMVDRGGATWLELSLATRTLLVNTWRALAPLSAQQLLHDLSDLTMRLSTSAEEALTQGRSLLRENPAAALMWLDLARRANPPPAGVEAAFQEAQALVSGQAVVWVEQGRRDLSLGQYEAAERSFVEAISASSADPDLVLVAARWRTAVVALQQARQAELEFANLSARALEWDLIHAVELAGNGDTERAREEIEGVQSRLPTVVNLTALQGLHAELQTWQLWHRAQTVERLADAAAAYAAVQAQQPYVPYWSELVAVLGDPIEAWLAAYGKALSPVEISPAVAVTPVVSSPLAVGASSIKEIKPVLQAATTQTRHSMLPILGAAPLILLVALLIGLIFAFWMQIRPELPDVVMATPRGPEVTSVASTTTANSGGMPVSPTVTATRLLLTATLEPSAPTPMSTSTPSPTPMSTSTPSPTRVPTSTPSPTPVPTSTPSPTPNLTPTLRPMRTPTSTPRRSPAPLPPLEMPELISPDNEASVQGKVTFNWKWSGRPLMSNEGFELLVWAEGNNVHGGAAPPTSTTSLELDLSSWANGRYLWSVVVVEKSPYKRLGQEASPHALSLSNSGDGPR